MISRRIKILDSFRGLAALIVVFHHVYTRFNYLYNVKIYPGLHGIFSSLSDLNREAVLFFFVLSGFSIRLSLRKGMPVTKALLNDYLFRRFNRILPLYVISILVTALTGVVIQQMNSVDFSLGNLFGNLVFLQISTSYKGYWFSPYGDNGPLWSLSFEMFYYLFFPVFIFVMFKIFKREFVTSKVTRYILGIAFLFSLFCIVLNKFIFFPYIAFGTLFYVWFLGFFLADLYLKNQLLLNINLIVLLVFMVVTATLHFVQNSASITMLFSGSVIACLFYMFYIIRKRIPYSITLNIESLFNFLFYRIGRGSYALYLLHYPLILLFLHYHINSLLLIILSMTALSVICVVLEEKFVKTKFSIFKLNYFP